MNRTIAKKVLWENDFIIMQNLSDILPLFCTPTPTVKTEIFLVEMTFGLKGAVSRHLSGTPVG